MEFSGCGAARNKRACRKIKEERITLIDTRKTGITTVAQTGRGGGGRGRRIEMDSRPSPFPPPPERGNIGEAPARRAKSPASTVPSLRDDEGRIKERARARASPVIRYILFTFHFTRDLTRPAKRAARNENSSASSRDAAGDDASRHRLEGKKNIFPETERIVIILA